MGKFKSINKKTKLIAIIVIIAVVLASAFAVHSNIKDKSDASGVKGEMVQTSSEKETKADAKEENKGDGSSKDSKDKEKSDADKSKEDTDSKEAGEKVDSEATSTSKPSSSASKGESSGSTTKPAVSKPSSSSGASTSKPSTSTSKPNNNTSSGSSSGNSSSNTSKPNKPAHTHNWQPVYETVTKYTTDLVTKYYCNGKYFDDYDSGCEYFHWCTDNAIGASLYPVNVEVEVSYEEEVLVGYKCSCGATKSC